MKERLNLAQFNKVIERRNKLNNDEKNKVFGGLPTDVIKALCDEWCHLTYCRYREADYFRD